MPTSNCILVLTDPGALCIGKLAKIEIESRRVKNAVTANIVYVFILCGDVASSITETQKAHQARNHSLGRIRLKGEKRQNLTGMDLLYKEVCDAKQKEIPGRKPGKYQKKESGWEKKLIIERRVFKCPREQDYPGVAIDTFLISFVEERGRATMRIILLGPGTDRATGMRVINDKVGAATRHAPDAARHRGMAAGMLRAGPQFMRAQAIDTASPGLFSVRSIPIFSITRCSFSTHFTISAA